MPATVLVVDDDPQVRRLVATILERVGYRAVTAASMAEASAAVIAARQDLALVVTDVELPDGSGLDLARAIAPSKIPVVVLTSLPIESEARAAGAAAFLAKPFQVAELVELVRSLLESSGPSATARE